jgi:hypothetical protein
MGELTHFANGAVSGMFGVVISHPIDTIKTNVQDKKPISCKPRHLYRGVGSALAGVGLEKAIVFGTYLNTKNYLDQHSEYKILNIATAGALSGLAASLVVTPAERLKILAQTRQKITIKELSPKSMFRGMSATFSREVPGFAIYMSTYEFLKTKHETKSQKIIPLQYSFLYGGLSGATAWSGIYPQDVVKTRMQANIDPNLNTSFKQTAAIIYKEGGLKVFYKGFHLALLRAIPFHSGTFMMMEIMRRYNKS